MKKPVSLFAVFAVLFSSVAALYAEPGAMFGTLYTDGEIVRTVIPPAAMKKPGTDDLYFVTNGASGQLPVIAVAPGDRDYRGGKWAFHFVTWNVPASPLTSEAAVLAAASVGDVTIMRFAENDFKCPVQP